MVRLFMTALRDTRPIGFACLNNATTKSIGNESTSCPLRMNFYEEGHPKSRPHKNSGILQTSTRYTTLPKSVGGGQPFVQACRKLSPRPSPRATLILSPYPIHHSAFCSLPRPNLLLSFLCPLLPFPSKICPVPHSETAQCYLRQACRRLATPGLNHREN